MAFSLLLFARRYEKTIWFLVTQRVFKAADAAILSSHSTLLRGRERERELFLIAIAYPA